MSKLLTEEAGAEAGRWSEVGVGKEGDCCVSAKEDEIYPPSLIDGELEIWSIMVSSSARESASRCPPSWPLAPPF